MPITNNTNNNNNSNSALSLPPLTSGSKYEKENNQQNLFDTPILNSSSSNGVLRIGETLESLFMMSQFDNDPQYEDACRKVVDPNTNSVELLRVWKYILDRFQSHSSHNTAGLELKKLYRRALKQIASSGLPKPSLDVLADLYIQYCQLLVDQDNNKDAILVIRTCAQKLQLPKLFHYWKQLERQSNDNDRKQNQSKDTSTLTNKSSNNSASFQLQPPSTNSHTYERLQTNSASKSSASSGLGAASSNSSVPQASEINTIPSAAPRSVHNNDSASNPSNPTGSSSSNSTASEKSTITITQRHPPEAKKTTKTTSSGKPPLILPRSKISTTGTTINTIKTSSKRPPRPGLKSFGLGKAARVDPNVPQLDEDDDDDTTAIAQHATPPASKKPRLITKSDLGYMFSWDPNARLSNIKSNNNNTSTTHSTNDHQKDTKSSTPSASVSSDDSSKPPKTPNPTTKQSDIDPDFAPLICGDNLIPVNDEKFAKLGVIGKGGSCKVYRVLSKSCQIFALKKVKLEHLDQKAIDGYSNEIALLQRLKGNPSIIQLYDSQIVPNKAIYLVMELGEADLNCVLQSQLKENHRLDINFVRLTWQQMLRAVHSIHEAKIIHGDLKPANFLFVRGSLKLIDFGIAKAIASDDTTNIYRDSQIGTLNYMSPEAIQDSQTSTEGQRMRCGRPSDVWSLGCILYQLLYGRTPFAQLHVFPKLQAIVNPNHAIEYGPADALAIDAVQQCLRRKPQERAPIVGRRGLLNEHCFLQNTKTSK